MNNSSQRTTNLGIVCDFTESLKQRRIAADVDYVVVDFACEDFDSENVESFIKTVQSTGAFAFARVPEGHFEMAQQLIKIGMEGIIFPMISTPQDAKNAVIAVAGSKASFTNNRVFSFSRQARRPKTDVAACILIIETVNAVQNLKAILQVPGIDAIYVGPGDLRNSLDKKLKASEKDKVLQSLYEVIIETCASHHIPVGIHSGDGNEVNRFIELGFNLISVSATIK